MNEEIRILRKELGIDDWLELAKEDKNLKGAYISFGQYIDILEKREKQLQNNWNELKKFAEEEIIECKTIINKLLPEFEKIMPRSSGKTLLINEYNKLQTIIKCFEVALSKMQELDGNNVNTSN